MYLKHFQLKQAPFSLTPNTDFYCQLHSHEEALNTILFSLKQGDGFIKVTGEVGVGKTMLCRKLLNSLDDTFVTCYIPNPDLSPDGLRKALAVELHIEVNEHQNQHSLLCKINEVLLQHHRDHRNVVLVVDEAQALSNETLETLRLFTNLETESTKLLQIVLIGQPELNQRLQNPALRQLLQRISFSCHIQPLNPADIEHYLSSRLIAAGHPNGILFNEKSRKYLYKKSHGIPRVFNTLCHKALIAAYGCGETHVSMDAAKKAVKDTDATYALGPYNCNTQKTKWWNYSTLVASGLILGSTLVYSILHFMPFNT